jgi:hypothetical protein
MRGVKKMTASPAGPDSPLTSLERSMGLATVGGSAQSAFSPGDGIESDPEATPPAGRTLCHYGGDDPLFSSPSPVVANATAPMGTAETITADDDDNDDDDDGDGDLGGILGGLDLTALGPGGDPSALIAQLEAMADEFERQSGQPEMEIRSQITMLRSVLAARPAAVARTRGQMDAALHAIEAQEHPLPAANALAERAVQSLCADNLASIEVTMDAVGSALRDDPATAAIVAQMLVPTSRYSGTRIESNA